MPHAATPVPATQHKLPSTQHWLPIYSQDRYIPAQPHLCPHTLLAAASQPPRGPCPSSSIPSDRPPRIPGYQPGHSPLPNLPRGAASLPPMLHLSALSQEAPSLPPYLTAELLPPRISLLPPSRCNPTGKPETGFWRDCKLGWELTGAFLRKKSPSVGWEPRTHSRTDPRTSTCLSRVGLPGAGTCWGRSGGLRRSFSTAPAALAQKHLGPGRYLSIQYLPSSSGRFCSPAGAHPS